MQQNNERNKKINRQIERFKDIVDPGMCMIGRPFWLVDKEQQDNPMSDIGKLSEDAYKDVIAKIRGLPTIRRPSKKREALKEIYDQTNKTIQAYYTRRGKKAEAVMVDNLIPILEFLIIRSGIKNVCAELEFIKETMPSSCANGIAGFMETTFAICLELIEKVDYRALVVNKLAMAEDEKSSEAVRRAFYDSYKAPRSFLNTVFLDVIKKHPIGKASCLDIWKFTGEFGKARDVLEAKTRDSLKKERLTLKDKGALQRACRDVIAEQSYSHAMEVFEYDADLKALNKRINSEMQAMKRAVTFEMIDPEHRETAFDVSKLVPYAATFGDRTRSVSERMKSLYELGVLSGKEGKAGAVGLAFIRAGVQDLCTQVYLFNTFAIAGEEEESKAVRVLIEAERAVKHVSETWGCTESMRRAGWKREVILSEVSLLLVGGAENRYKSIVANACKKVAEAPSGKSAADCVAGLAESVARDVLCGCPEGATGAAAHDVIYAVVEAALVKPNYARVLRLFAAEAEEADAATDRHIAMLGSTVKNPGDLGVNQEYFEGNSRDSNTTAEKETEEKDESEEKETEPRAVVEYAKAIDAMKGIGCSGPAGGGKTGQGELRTLEGVLGIIAKCASAASGKPTSRIDERSVVRLLSFVIIHSGARGLHGHVLFMEAFLAGNKVRAHNLSLLKEALNTIDAYAVKTLNP